MQKVAQADLPRKESCGEPDRRPSEESADRRLGYIFDPIPRSARDAVAEGRLKAIDLAVLGVMLEFRTRLITSCWITRRVIAKRLNRDEKTIQRSWRRLRNAGFLRLVEIPAPDPDEPRNGTGYRHYFAWMEAASSGPDRPERVAGTGAPPPSDHPGPPPGGANVPQGKVESTGGEINVSSSTGPPPPETAAPVDADPPKNDDDDSRGVQSVGIEDLAAEASRAYGEPFGRDVRASEAQIRKAIGENLAVFLVAIRWCLTKYPVATNPPRSPFAASLGQAKKFAADPELVADFLAAEASAAAADLEHPGLYSIETPRRELTEGELAAEALVLSLAARGVALVLCGDGRIRPFAFDPSAFKANVVYSVPTEDERKEIARRRDDIASLLALAPDTSRPSWLPSGLWDEALRDHRRTPAAA